MKRHVKISLINSLVLISMAVPLLISSMQIDESTITDKTLRKKVDANKLIAMIVSIILLIFSLMTIIGIFVKEKKC